MIVPVDSAPSAHILISARVLIAALELMQRGGDEPTAVLPAGGQRDRTAVHVDPSHVGLVHAGPLARRHRMPR
jgi:hypothetical protein